MRGEQFYPITASGGASSKAFWPGLLPWDIAILQETHQTHERGTSRVTLLCLHHNSPRVSPHLTGSYSLRRFVPRLTEIASDCLLVRFGLIGLSSCFQIQKTYLNVGIVLNLIGSVSRILFSSAGTPHLNQRSRSQIYFSCCSLGVGLGRITVLLHFNHAADSYVHLPCSITYSSVFSPAVCFPTASCSRQYSQGGGVGWWGGTDAAILEAVVHANVCLMSSQRK